VQRLTAIARTLRNERVRAYLYRLSVVVLPILTGAGMLTESKAGMVIGLIGAMLSAGPGVLAAANTAAKSPDRAN
jgi:hypothetical protein